MGKVDRVVQTEKVHENLKKCLESVGATMRDIVMLRIFVTDLDAFKKPVTFEKSILERIARQRPALK